MVSIPILTYHSANVDSNTYAENDHIALSSDLQSIYRCGRRVVSLAEVFSWQQGNLELEDNCVAITFDDGTDFDFRDLTHPICGHQRSFANILSEHQHSTGQRVVATAFVIASPVARKSLDSTGLLGLGWWSDDWWLEAHRTGQLSIECHSWDHVHPDLEAVAQVDNIKGDFEQVATKHDCDQQVLKAGQYIADKLEGSAPRFFAYPWGQYSDYLVNIYMPEYRKEHGFKAAFTTQAEPVTQAHSAWELPRFVCGRDWTSPREFEQLLLEKAPSKLP